MHSSTPISIQLVNNGTRSALSKGTEHFFRKGIARFH